MNKKLCCLLVSPLPGDRPLVEQALGREFPDLQITQVVDVAGWQEALAAGGFDLGIIPEALPWAETSALVQGIKSRQFECPVVMLAAPDREETAQEALHCGLDDYVLRSPQEMPRWPGVIRAARHRARYRAGEALKAGEANFRALFDAVPEIVFMHDPETGGLLDANQEACHRLGYTREELMHLNIDAISLGEPPCSQEDALRSIRKTVEEGPQLLEWLGRTKAGKPLWLEVNSKRAVIGGQERVISFGRIISQYKRTQEALKEAENRYETLLDSAADAILIHDTDGGLLQVNDAACKLLGYSRAELQQMTLKDIEAPANPGILKKIRESHQQGHVFVETALQRRDGAVVPVELGSRFIEYAGLPVVFSIARDITGRKEVEEKLRQSEILYRSIFETTGTATCISDENNILLLVNDESVRLTGYSREELEGKKSWTEFIVPEDLERLMGYQRLRRQDPGAAPKSYTLRWQDRQGRTRGMLATISLVPGTKKTVASLLDITVQQQTEKALRESEERYRILVETMNDGLGLQDEKGVLTFANQRFCEMLGYERQEMLNRPVRDFLDPANQEILEEQMQRRRRGERQPYELTWTRKDGTTVTASMSPAPIFDAAGKFQGSFAVIADLTPRQEAEKALRASEEKYRAIFENSGTAIGIVNEDHTLFLVNSEFAKLSGYSREELEGKKSWMEFASAADQLKMTEYHRLRRIDPHLPPRSYEARFFDRQGEVKVMLVTASMLPGTNKSVGSLVDITARKKAEQELEFERKKFQILTEYSPFAIVMIDKDGIFKYINPRFSELFGYTLEDVPDGRTWFRKAYPDPAYRQQVISSWVDDLESAKPGEKRPRTYTVSCKDGTEKIISFIPLQLDNGDNLMTCEDVTAQYQAAEAVKRSEQHFRLLIENSMFHLRIIDADGTIRYESPTLERFLGYLPGEQEGLNAFEFVHPDDQALAREKLGWMLENPGLVASAEMRYRHRDGTWRWLHIRGKNLLYEPIINGIVLNAHDTTERKQAEEAVKQSEQRFRLLMENSMVHLAVVDAQGKVLYDYPAMERFLGYEIGELEGQSAFELMHPEDLPRALEVLRQMLESPGKVFSEEVRYRHQDGSWRFLEVKAKNLLDEPLIRGIVVNAQDITERKEAEEAVRQSEQRFRLLMENSMVHLAVIDAQGTVLYENPTMERLLGYEIGELKGTNAFEFIHPEDLPGALEVMRQLLAFPGKVVAAEVRYRHKDGSWRIMEVKAKNLLEEPVIRGIVVNTQDITERKLAEEAVRQSEQRFRLLMENSMAQLAVIDTQGTVIYENPTMERLLGYEIGELDGKNAFELIHPEDLPRALEVMRQLLEFPGKVFSVEVRYRHKDRSWHILEVKAKNLLDEPVIRGIVVNAQDITERKEAEEAVRQSERRFRLLMENSMVHLAIIDAQGTVIYENPSMESPLGYESGEFEGKNRLDLMHPEDLPRALEVLSQMLEAPGKVFTEEVRYRHKDGSWRWLEVKGKNLLDEPLIQGIVTNIQDITQRKEMLEALRQSEERYRAIVEDQTELVSRFLEDGTITFVNETLCRYYGKTREELIDANFYPYLPEDEKVLMANKIAALNLDNPIATHEHRIVTADGQVVWVQWTKRAIFDDQGRIIEFQGVGRDITERRRTEEALRQSEAEKSLILRHMSEKLVYYDLDNRIVWANMAMADFVGMTPEQMIGRFCYEILHQRHTPCPDCQVIRFMKAGQPAEIEVVKSDGRIIFYRSSPVRDENGAIQGNVLLTRDVTASRKAEAAIKASEEKMRLVIETSPVGIRITQPDRHIYVNPALVRMFGYERADEIVEQPGNIIFDPTDWNLLREKREAALAGKPGPASFEAKGLKKDGTRLDVQVWQTEIDYQGAPALLDFILDFSEANALRSQLLQAQKMEAMGTLAGGIAHDFNNILLPILINAEMMLEGLAPDNPLRSKLERVIRACRRAIDLVKQILAFSRHEERDLSPVQLSPIISDSLQLLRATLPATIEMRWHLENDGDIVLADPTQIQQVVINLCTNAAHALGEGGGVIDISLTRVGADAGDSHRPPDLAPGPCLQLIVRDNGHGMDPATMERIFDPYFTTKKPEEGTGLGLAVVHGIVKKHGGAIRVESEPGKGSAFHVFLPGVEAEETPEPGDSIPLPLGRERILLVDDDSEIVATLQQMLEQLGYRVVAFMSGAQALNAFRAQPQDFDLLITDQIMPQMTGEDLAREILGLRPDLPIIICTGFSEKVFAKKARTLGIREFIIKPFARREVAETIRRALMTKHEVN